MSTKWDSVSNTYNTTSWTRSWRQEFYTDLGSDFTAKIHMERVTAFENTTIPAKHDLAGAYTRKMSDLKEGTPLYSAALAMQAAITTFVDAVKAEAEAEAAAILAAQEAEDAAIKLAQDTEAAALAASAT